MDIRIELDEPDPPAGRVSTPTSGERVFVGWLGLIGELSELIVAETTQTTGPTETAGTADRVGSVEPSPSGSSGDLARELDP